MIQAYFAQVKEIVDQYGVTNFVLEARVSFELRPAGQGYLTGVFTFADGSALHCRDSHHPWLDVNNEAHVCRNRLNTTLYLSTNATFLLYQFRN